MGLIVETIKDMKSSSSHVRDEANRFWDALDRIDESNHDRQYRKSREKDESKTSYERMHGDD